MKTSINSSYYATLTQVEELISDVGVVVSEEDEKKRSDEEERGRSPGLNSCISSSLLFYDINTC